MDNLTQTMGDHSQRRLTEAVIEAAANGDSYAAQKVRQEEQDRATHLSNQSEV